MFIYRKILKEVLKRGFEIRVVSPVSLGIFTSGLGRKENKMGEGRDFRRVWFPESYRLSGTRQTEGQSMDWKRGGRVGEI